MRVARNIENGRSPMRGCGKLPSTLRTSPQKGLRYSQTSSPAARHLEHAAAATLADQRVAVRKALGARDDGRVEARRLRRLVLPGERAGAEGLAVEDVAPSASTWRRPLVHRRPGALGSIAPVVEHEEVSRARPAVRDPPHVVLVEQPLRAVGSVRGGVAPPVEEIAAAAALPPVEPAASARVVLWSRIQTSPSVGVLSAI